VNLLLDTNVFLEVLLGQQQAASASALLSNGGNLSLFMTDFSLHSIGVLLFRRRSFDVFAEFVGDLETAGIRVLSLHPRHVSTLAEPATRHNLDFDDAYQYEIAKRFGLTLVSFDSDFDRTDLKRNTPQEILERLG
jgi:predicted nucleic acid-binding protein